MSFWVILLAALLNHSCFKATKVLMSLFALDLGASPATIGMLYAMYSLFPILLSVYAGKLSDRSGFRVPVMVSSFGMAVSLLLAFHFPGLATLFVIASDHGSPITVHASQSSKGSPT